MKITAFALTILSVVTLGVEGIDDIPFYLKLSDSNPSNVIAVVYYGALGDESKEIDVPCNMKSTTNTASSDKYVGPESITCQCEAIRRGCSGWGSSHTKVIDNSKCQLQVPFYFEHDVNGTITSVTFYKDDMNSTGEDILIVPFYPKKNSDGNIVAVEITGNESTQESTSSSARAAISLLLWFVIVVGGMIVLVALVRIVRNLIGRRSSKTSPTTSTGTNPMNVKNMADLENPQDHHRHTNRHSNNNDDDDTATDDSSSDN